MTLRFTTLCAAALAAVALAGCGDDKDSAEGAAATPAATTAADGVDFAPIKTYLLDHTQRLTTATSELATEAQTYFDLAKSVDFDGNRLLADHRDDVAKSVEAMQKTWREANPAYEEMEGIVAGVPSLASYDNILDAGSDASDPENAVPFDLKYEDGTVLKKPGNYFFLTETSLWGSEEKFTVKGVEADLNDDGKIEYGEALPNPQHILAAAKGFDGQAQKLAASAEAWQPTESDVFNAVVVMTPTMAEYFEAWKNSRFVAGTKATEASFIGASRLIDITGILSGLVVIYDRIEPKIASEDPQTAEQAGENLNGLLTYVEKLRDSEEKGRKYTAEQAETYGTEAQKRAEAIAGQVSQAADALNIKLDA
ncbi:MAG: imelysin family protein [Solirubrobacteraceae bacterium]|nr:imelysin family protein [Solirubrobacteraceae bacterium]